MQLLAMRQEVEAHGFSDITYGARINRYLNDAYLQAVRRVSYYVNEAVLDFSTVAGTASYSQPTDFAKDRSLRDLNRTGEFKAVGLRTIDRSVPSTAPPYAYAIDGVLIHLYPTPDQVYSLELRYWKLPAVMVADTDSPTIPDDYCDLLVYWAINRCYASEDDSQTAQYWMQQYNTRLQEFSTDVRFPNDDAPTQVASMWEGPPVLSRGWTRSDLF